MFFIFTNSLNLPSVYTVQLQQMTTDIVEFLEQSTNTVAGYFTLQSDWLHKNLCVIYKEITGKPTCDGTEETLLAEVGLSLWGKMLQLETQGESTAKDIKMIQSSGMGHGIEDGGDNTSLESFRVKFDMVENNMQDVKGKIGKMESKIDMVETKIGTMEGKIGAVEENVKDLKDSMEDMKDMIMKMMEVLAEKGGE